MITVEILHFVGRVLNLLGQPPWKVYGLSQRSQGLLSIAYRHMSLNSVVEANNSISPDHREPGGKRRVAFAYFHKEGDSHNTLTEEETMAEGTIPVVGSLNMDQVVRVPRVPMLSVPSPISLLPSAMNLASSNMCAKS